MLTKQALNDKLQCTVALFLKCGGVVNNQIKKGLLLGVRVKKIKINEYLAISYKQERGCLMHLCAWPRHC